MHCSRRESFPATGAASASLAVPRFPTAEMAIDRRKPHVVTLDFDDGFKKSFARIADIWGKHKLSACLNVGAAGPPEDG
jgi:hypothetical protein